ncbi:hypothetical protein V6N13_023344 [Hibiscus sabdariffa]|uniref:Uncharacterized protein n=2 Tax=Hibiscus sabdariffa TaxID=183260 RepID=A0ABR2B4V3_9ROSI
MPTRIRFSPSFSCLFPGLSQPPQGHSRLFSSKQSPLQPLYIIKAPSSAINSPQTSEKKREEICVFMSLRYASRLFYQSGMRAVQLMKDHASKCEANLRSLKDSASASSSSSSKQARRLSNTVDLKAAASKNDRLKQAEESLRTVMFLSCWGPN